VRARQVEANPDPALRDRIAGQVRTAVSELGSAATPEVWAKVELDLRQNVANVVDDSLPFRLPRFQILAFRRVTAPQHRSRQANR